MSPKLNDTIYIYILIYSFNCSAAWPVQLLCTTGKACQFQRLITKTKVEKANKAVAKVLEPTSKTGASRVTLLIVYDFTANNFPSSRKNEHAVDNFLGMFPTTLLV